MTSETYQIKSSDNSKYVVINPYTTNGPTHPSSVTLHEKAVMADSSLILLGKGMENYGDEIASNFYHLLENFYSDLSPSYPINGMLWYDKTHLRVYDTSNWIKIPRYSIDELSLDVSARLINITDPINPADAVNLQYCEDHFLSLSGGTLINGSVVDLNGSSITGLNDPINDTDASNKKYVDDNVGGSNQALSDHISDFTLHLTNSQNILLDGITASFTEINRLDGISGNVQSLLDLKLNLSGGILTGQVKQPLSPTSGKHLTNKIYVDNKVLTVTNDLASHIGDDSVHVTPAQRSLLDGLEYGLTSQDLNYTNGLTDYAQNQLNRKLDRFSGGNITGITTISVTPTTSLELTNKQYVDDKFNTLVKYSLDFVVADWVGGEITILSSTHNKGTTKYLFVQVFQAGTPNLLSITDVEITDTGDVTIKSLTPFDGYVLIS